MGEQFKSMHNWIETQLVTKMKAYIQFWYNSPTGKAYQSKWQAVKLISQYYYTVH